MPASRRRYLWRYTPDLKSQAVRYVPQVRDVLESFTDRWPQWYADTQVGGDALGFVEFAVTVTCRDQWWIGRRATRVLSAVRAFTDVPIDKVELVSVERLAPHDHRGKTYLKEVRDGRSDTDPAAVS